MGNERKTIIIVVASVLIIVAGTGFLFWLKSRQSSSVPSSQAQKAPTLGGQIFDKTQNQLQGQVPDTNPFKDQKNPLDTIYKNPFE